MAKEALEERERIAKKAERLESRWADKNRK